MSVDRDRRDGFAKVLRKLAVGQITNDEFESTLSDILYRPVPAEFWQDKSLKAIQDMSWFFYDELTTHYLTGKWRLSKENKTLVARCILFLYSNYEYKWTLMDLSFESIVLSILTLGWYSRHKNHQWRKQGNFDIWPFWEESEYAEALKNPKLLSGKRKQ